MMASTSTVTVAQWLEIRNELTAVVRSKTSSQNAHLVAEALMTRGFIDVDAVQAVIAERQRPTADAGQAPDA